MLGVRCQINRKVLGRLRNYVDNKDLIHPKTIIFFPRQKKAGDFGSRFNKELIIFLLMSTLIPRLCTHYNSIVCQDIIYAHGVQNMMQIPRPTQCALNSTGGEKDLLPIQVALQCVSGQKGKNTSARKSIAAFQIRKRDRLGCATNLRGERLYFFMDYFVSIFLPSTMRKDAYRVQRVGKGKSGKFGVKKMILFPELQQHHTAFSDVSGCECEFSVGKLGGGGKKRKYISLDTPSLVRNTLLTSFQFPSTR